LCTAVLLSSCSGLPNALSKPNDVEIAVIG
jgi:starvation-inducible outer membrane lipoprotein